MTGNGTSRDDSPVLEARNIVKTFDGIQALAGLSLSVRRGLITGLIGPNGAGKSTFFNVVSGVLRADRGSVMLFGEDVTGLPSHQVARRGVVRTFQISRELARLTTLENLMLAPHHQLGERFRNLAFRPWRVRRQEAELFARARDVLDFVALSDVMDEYAENLSGGQKKLLELARALMIDPDLILLDEPGAGVNPALMETLTQAIARLNREHGKTFLIIEHDMDLVARLCQHVLVMANGALLTEGPFEKVARETRVIDAYLGSAG